MMRGPSYDDGYISRKMAHMPGPTFSPPGSVSYGRPPYGGYLQDPYHFGFMPMSYPPPPRYMPRYYPSYYDYDYGYGGYYGGYYPSMYPRISRYDYLDDYLDSPYLATSYRPRAIDVDTDKSTSIAVGKPSRVVTTTRTYSPGVLQDHVDNMRVRLKSLAYSLDPTGPVPEIIVPERTTKKSPAAEDKKYSSATEFSELPKLASRRQRYYPEDEHMKDNLRIQCLSHYKTTRTAADYNKTRLYDAVGTVMPESSYRASASKYSSTKWEEPDTVFGGPTDRKPYSKVETGSSFFSTYGYTNRKKDFVAEKVRDYYYFGDSEKAITDGTTEEAGEEKKERRKKKKSKEREVVAEGTTEVTAAAAAADHSISEAEPVSAPAEGDAAPAADSVDDEKERKRLEKKKRKAEREAAAKAAMEAELAALAAAEAELARLEAESNKTDAPAPEATPAEPAAEPAAEVKSESAAEK